MADEYDSEPASVPPGYGANQALVGRSAMQIQDLRVPKIRTILEHQIKELEAQTTERRNLLKQLDEQPAVEKLLDTMRKLGV